MSVPGTNVIIRPRLGWAGLGWAGWAGLGCDTVAAEALIILLDKTFFSMTIDRNWIKV